MREKAWSSITHTGLQIVPAIQTAFDAAYYAMAQYVSASPDYPLHWGGRMGITISLDDGMVIEGFPWLKEQEETRRKIVKTC